MKKRLEAELISIAHRILKLKNKSEVDQLYKETQKLYDTLAVLKFYQDNFESVKSDVTEAVLEEKLEQSNQTVSEPEPKVEIKEEIAEPVAEVEEIESADKEAASEPEIEEEAEAESEEEIVVSEKPEDTVEEDPSESEQAKQLEEPALTEDSEDTEQEEASEEELVSEEKPLFEPIFELEEEEEVEEEKVNEVKTVEKLEDHIGRYADPVFVKPNDVTLFPTDSSDSELAKQTTTEIPAETREEIITAITPVEVPKTAAMSDAMSKSIAIGLNDRIGFVKHLFNDSNEDFNRVISQLNTFDTFEEAKTFINEMVIPDYNYWVGEEEYIERFMAIVEKKFQ
ncbi:MAG: hypothetical protein M0D53_08130 [Flavobacterium sp. JAD_PAG50586_2]|nr:MAG: hypothetical protein M0D53_08130 [Flavobacterium sp. JAD_PAG50586_2]